MALGTGSNVASANLFGNPEAYQHAKNTIPQVSVTPDYKVVLVTTMGNITIELFGDMPITYATSKAL
jgi:hypothetical protein